MRIICRALLTGIALFWAVAVHVDAKPNEIGVKVGVYGQETHSAYTTAHGLPSNDISSLAVTPGGDLYAGTAKGLAKFSDGHWTPVTALGDMPINRLAPVTKTTPVVC